MHEYAAATVRRGVAAQRSSQPPSPTPRHRFLHLSLLDWISARQHGDEPVLPTVRQLCHNLGYPLAVAPSFRGAAPSASETEALLEATAQATQLTREALLSQLGDSHLSSLSARGYMPVMRALGRTMFEVLCAWRARATSRCVPPTPCHHCADSPDPSPPFSQPTWTRSTSHWQNHIRSCAPPASAPFAPAQPPATCTTSVAVLATQCTRWRR